MIRRLAIATVAFATLLQGCGSSVAETQTPTPGSITLTLSPSAASIQQGGSTQVSGTIARTNFTGDVAITVSGAPTGVTGTVTLAPVSGGNAAQVTLTAASSTPVGVYQLVVTARGVGIDSATAGFTLTIAAATPASYTMTVATPSLSFVQSGNGTSALTFVRTAFTGDIALTAENLPAGVTVAFTTNPVTGTTSSVTFTATASAAPGTFSNVLLRGTAAGLTDVTAPVTLTVSIAGTFTIAAGAPSVTTVQGSPASTTINATRLNGFVNTISYTVTGPANAALPTGLGATITLGASDHNTLNVTTTPTLAAGTYPLVVHATSPGLTEQTANVSVIVTALPVGTTVHLDFSICSTSERPIWLAVQDGSGAFTPVTGVANVFTFTVTSPKAAFAWVDQFNATAFTTQVQYFAKTESGALVIPCTNVVPPGKTYTGTLAGIPAGTASWLTIATNSLSFSGLPGGFALANVPSGVFDLVGFRSDGSITSSAQSRAIIRRDLNLPAGSVLPVVDYAGAESVAAASATVTVASKLAGETIDMEQRYYTGQSCSPAYLYGPSPLPSLTGLMLGIPTSLQRATDFHAVNVRGNIPGANTSFRTAQVSYHTMANINITLPAQLNPTVTDITGAGSTYRLLQSVVPMPAGIQAMYLQYVDAAGHTMIVTHTAGYLAGAATATIIAPDLGAIAGYGSTWGVSKTANVGYRNAGSGSTGANPCSDGATVNTTRIDGSIAAN